MSLKTEYGIPDATQNTGWNEPPTDSTTNTAANAAVNPFLILVEDGADMQAAELPPVVEIIKGIVTEHSKLVIGSGSKSYKTWLSIDAALSVAHAADFLGRGTERRKVLYVNLELKASTFSRRLQSVAQAKGITVDRGWFHHLPLRGKLAGASLAVVITRIIEVAKKFGATVIVLDPVYKLNTAGDENSSKDMTVFFNELDRLTTEVPATVILNDHFGKGNQSEKDPLDAIRGSSAKGGDLDAAMVLRRHDVEECFRVDMVHRELPPVHPFVVGWDFPLMVVREDLDPEDMKKPGRPRTPEAALLRHIAHTTPEQPITVTQWAEAANVERSALSKRVTEMREAGLVATVGDGAGARKYITQKGKKLLA